MAWLRQHQGEVISSLTSIAKALGLREAYYVSQALTALQRRGIITWRHGTRSKDRGHQAIRVLATGRCYHTENCPWSAP